MQTHTIRIPHEAKHTAYTQKNTIQTNAIQKHAIQKTKQYKPHRIQTNPRLGQQKNSIENTIQPATMQTTQYSNKNAIHKTQYKNTIQTLSTLKTHRNF